MQIPRPRISRSVTLGLAAGLAISALTLIAVALFSELPSCVGLMPDECELERDIGIWITGVYLLGAFGLSLISGGLFLSLKQKTPSAA